MSDRKITIDRATLEWAHRRMQILDSERFDAMHDIGQAELWISRAKAHLVEVDRQRAQFQMVLLAILSPKNLEDQVGGIALALNGREAETFSEQMQLARKRHEKGGA